MLKNIDVVAMFNLDIYIYLPNPCDLSRQVFLICQVRGKF